MQDEGFIQRLKLELISLNGINTDRFFYFIFNTEKSFPDNADVTVMVDNKPVDKPLLETKNLDERMKKYIKYEFGCQAWK